MAYSQWIRLPSSKADLVRQVEGSRFAPDAWRTDSESRKV